LGSFCAQGELRLVRDLRLHVADTIADPVHVGVHADGRDFKALHEDQVGGLAPHARQGGEFLQRLGHLAVVAVQQDAADGQQPLGFGRVEPHRIDLPFDFLRCQRDHRFRCPGHTQQPSGRHAGHFVLGAQGKQGGNQHLEGRGPPVGDEGDDRRIPPAVMGFDGGHKAVDVKGALSGHGNQHAPVP
jgi:hypothetical protein